MALTNEQLKLRLDGVGASEVAALFDTDPYKNAHAVWQEKVTGHSDFKQNRYTFFGDKLEGPVADIFEELYLKPQEGLSLIRPEDIWESPLYTIHDGGTLVSTRNPILRVTPDRLLSDRSGLVEIKLASHWSKMKYWGKTGEGKFPYHYYLQVMYQLHVTGLHRGFLVALLGGNQLGILKIQYDAQLAQEIENRVVDFWDNHVLTEEPHPDWMPYSTPAFLKKGADDYYLLMNSQERTN
jgi:putative phage-type endonuclease